MRSLAVLFICALFSVNLTTVAKTAAGSLLVVPGQQISRSSSAPQTKKANPSGDSSAADTSDSQDSSGDNEDQTDSQAPFETVLSSRYELTYWSHSTWADLSEIRIPRSANIARPERPPRAIS
jgi:hypothetical protein